MYAHKHDEKEVALSGSLSTFKVWYHKPNMEPFTLYLVCQSNRTFTVHLGQMLTVAERKNDPTLSGDEISNVEFALIDKWGWQDHSRICSTQHKLNIRSFMKVRFNAGPYKRHKNQTKETKNRKSNFVPCSNHTENTNLIQNKQKTVNC